MIKDQKKMENEVIPAHFSLKKFSSFIRQLHLYDFHKKKSGKETFIFGNPLFSCHERTMAEKIFRKRRPKSFLL